ncbi:MAG: Lrp/AsnC family transcriptional regulator [Candidatus Jordarchaeales archaeon]
MVVRFMSLDEIDRRILSEYLKDARRSSREIAKLIGVSTTTVIARTKRMEKDGIIKGYTVILDHEKLGYDITAITEITVSKGKLLDVEKEVAKIPSTCAVYDVTGEVDCIAIAKFRSRKELSEYTKQLLSIPYVERTNTHVVLTVVKEDFRII